MLHSFELSPASVDFAFMLSFVELLLDSPQGVVKLVARIIITRVEYWPNVSRGVGCIRSKLHMCYGIVLIRVPSKTSDFGEHRCGVGYVDSPVDSQNLSVLVVIHFVMLQGHLVAVVVFV